MKCVLPSVFMSLALAVSSVRADAAAVDGTVEDWPAETSLVIGTNLVLKTTTSSTEEWSVSSSDKEGYLDVKIETNGDGTATFTLTPLYAYDNWPLTVKHGSTTLKTFSIDIPAEEHTLVLQADETFTTNVAFFKETTWSVTGGKYVTATSSASGKALSTQVTLVADDDSGTQDVTVSRTNSHGDATPMHVFHVTVIGDDDDDDDDDDDNPSFTVTPYVQRPATNAMTVLFFTDDDCAATVRCWPADAADGVVTQELMTVGKKASALVGTGHSSDVPVWGTQCRHRGRFEGLKPGTRYAYEVRLAGAGTVYTNFFRTAPGRDTPVRFVAYSDSETIPPDFVDTTGNNKADSKGCTKQWEIQGVSAAQTYYVSRSEGYASNIVHMAAWQPDLCVIAGDLVARGGVQLFWDEFWKENAGGLGLGYNDPAGSVPILAALGNHDLYDNKGSDVLPLAYSNNKDGEFALAKYLTYFEFNSNGVDYAQAPAAEKDTRDLSQLFHREDYGPVTLIFVDSNNSEYGGNDTNKGLTRKGSSGARSPDLMPGSLQYAWLTNNLADAQANSRFTFVVCHHCPYSSGGHIVAKNDHCSQPIRELTDVMIRYGVDGWLCGHDEALEHSQVSGLEVMPDGTTRPHTVNVYDLGSAGDGLKGKPDAENDKAVFRAYSDAEDGLHYGHLQVEVAPSNGTWYCTMTPTYSYWGKVGATLVNEPRHYRDRIVIAEDATIVYEERLEPETEADVTIDSIYATRSQTFETTGKAGLWSCEVGDERYLSAAVTRKFDGSATVTVTGLAETSEEQVVRIYASAGTAEEPMLVKVITVRAVVALPPEPEAEDDVSFALAAGSTSNIVTTTAADGWSCTVESGLENYVTATATRRSDGTATVAVSAKYAYGNAIAVSVYAHSDARQRDYLVKTITVESIGVERKSVRIPIGGTLSASCSFYEARYWTCTATGAATVGMSSASSVKSNTLTIRAGLTPGAATVTVFRAKNSTGTTDKTEMYVYDVDVYEPEPTVEDAVELALTAGTAQSVTTTGVASQWNCTVSDPSLLTATLAANADGTATVTILGSAVYAGDLQVFVYAGSATPGKGTLVKTITVKGIGEENLIPAIESETKITEATVGTVQTVTTTGIATKWNCKCVAKSDVDWAVCIEASVVRNEDGTATVSVLPKGAYGDKLTVEVYAGSTVSGEGTLIKTITISKIVAATVVLLLKEGETFVTNCTFGVAHPWSCSTDKSGAYVTASVTTAEATETTLTIVGKAVGTETVTVKRTNGSYTTDAYKFAVTVEEASSEQDPTPSPDDTDETLVLAPGATTNLVTASVAAKWNCKASSSQVTATVTRRSDGTAQLTLKGASSLAEGSLAANVVTVGLYRGSSTAGSGTLLKTLTVRLGEAITLTCGGEPVTRSLSYSSERKWAVCRDADTACVTAALNVATEAYDKYSYSLRTTGKAKSVTLTLSASSVGEVCFGLARQYSDDESPKLMGVYYVTVVAGESTPFDRLRAAFEDGSGTYALETDVECPADESLTLAAGKSLVLDLNGHSLTCHRDGAIVNAGDLTIRDTTASGPFAAHVAFSEDELAAGYALVRNAADARLTVDGVYVDAGFISEDDYESSCANTAVSAEGGTVIVTKGGHLGGLCGIEAKGDCTITVDADASVCGTSWRGAGGRQLAASVLFASGTSVLTVRDAMLESEGWLVRSQAGSAATVSVTGSVLRSERASAPFELASGTSVAIADSSYEDLSAMKITTVTALANAGASLTVGAGCTLTVSGEGVIGFLGEGVGVEAAGTRTWRTVAETPSGGAWAAVSQTLGAATEFTQEPVISIETVAALSTGAGQDLAVRVAVREGEDIRQVDPAKVASFVEATSDLSDWTVGKLGLTVKSAVRNDDNTMDITLGLPSSKASGFVRISVK